ncbi:hypothetical protein ACHWQZ_G013940 [Mnemiopsis leidyi]
MEMIAARTPLKARNQEFTPALGKRQANRTMFATPTKRMMTATPRPTLVKKANCSTPSNLIFKKPRKSPSLKLPVKTPGKINLYKQASTPGKFTVYEDSEDEIIREMKRKNFKIEQPERCPWAEKTSISKSEPVPPLEIIDDCTCVEPSRKKRRPIKLDPLPIGLDQEELIFNLETEYPLPPLPDNGDDCEEPETCPWADLSTGQLDTSKEVEEVELELSTLSDIDITKERLSQISIRCFNESYRELENALSDEELPEMPSTPELDQELQELLELSFDTFHL